MDSAAKRATFSSKQSEPEKIVGFSPENLRSPFALRCAAFAIDYLILLILPTGWLMLGHLVGEGGSVVIGNPIWWLGTVLFLGNCLLLPLVRGQSVGKMLTGLTIVNIDGTRVGAGRILIRNILGYALTLLTFGLGFFIAAINSSGRTLHDFLAGTIVIHGRLTQQK